MKSKPVRGLWGSQSWLPPPFQAACRAGVALSKTALKGGRSQGWRPHIAILITAALCPAAVPTPKQHFGFTPGDDFKLADYNEIISYFQKLTRASDRILLSEFGKTAMGKPMYIAYISSPENLKNLDRYREISRRLA